jgi:ABC-type nitrate/sulfonate/bicarbonate transport system permease component
MSYGRTTSNSLIFLRRTAQKGTLFVVLLLFWSAFSYSGYIDPIFLPTPTAVLKEFISLFALHGFF